MNLPQIDAKLRTECIHKIKVIKAIRTVSSLSLGDAKNAVENTPFVVSEAAPKDEANKIKKTLEEAGAKVELS